MKIKENQLTDEDKGYIKLFIDLLDDSLVLHKEEDKLNINSPLYDKLTMLYKCNVGETLYEAGSLYKQLNQNVNNKNIKKLINYFRDKPDYFKYTPYYIKKDEILIKLINKCLHISEKDY